MPKKNQELNQTYIIIAVIIGIAILGYGFLQFQSKQNELKLKQEQTQKAELEKTNNEKKYNSCIYLAESSYSSTWEINCESKKLGKNCSLPMVNANALNDSLEKDKQRCVTLYKN